MLLDKEAETKQDIKESLFYCFNSMKFVGLSFDEAPNKRIFIFRKFILIFAITGVCFHVFSEVMNLIDVAQKSPKLEDVVPLLHIFSYGNLYYYYSSVYGVWLYHITPIAAYLYQRWQGLEIKMGFVWAAWYPFDKHKPFAYVMVYVFEVYVGWICIWIMMSSDLLFTGLASHIGLLLRILHAQLQSLGTVEKTEEEHYNDVLSCIKLHQRLISYCDSMEDAFTFVNFIHITVSSVNICCCVFAIMLLEPLLALGNKAFFISTLIQIGVSCWYADDIITSNEYVATAAYKSNWYKLNPRSRRALLFLMLRAQRPVAFTAMKFTNISMVTFSSILTRSYTYFALLYTMFEK